MEIHEINIFMTFLCWATISNVLFNIAVHSFVFFLNTRKDYKSFKSCYSTAIEWVVVMELIILMGSLTQLWIEVNQR